MVISHAYVAHDLFIHHFGSRTFAGNGIDVGTLLQENGRRFSEKWGTAAVGPSVSLRPWPESGNGPQMTQRNADPEERSSADLESGYVAPPRSASPSFHLRSSAKSVDKSSRASVSLTMIVRDEEKNISACLGSVRGLFDEIVVVDTGSKDRTRGIAREFGARVFDFVWVDDFAAARNAALGRATGDYAFWLAADDVIDPPEREKLKRLLGGLRTGAEARNGPHSGPYGGAEQAAYVLKCSCDPGPNGDGGQLLFRKAVVHRMAGQPAEAETTWRRILTLKRPEPFCSVDQGIYGHLTLRNLAALAQERGDQVEAKRMWKSILDECPGEMEATAKLAG
jgi:Glycosyl transferase family 2